MTMISSRLITSSLFGQITVTTPLDAAAQSLLKGITLKTGDTVGIDELSTVEGMNPF